ncbi:MAG TPA: SRPBCC domain-containing protein [Candidatus Acidoferrales bacterium]|nr:SRPBCC domain-containing protein [Candidatus Acidoferrales bacterium]
MKRYDWSRFVLRIPINSEVREIYDSWTTQTDLERWFLRRAAFSKPDKSPRPPNDHIKKGDTYEWLWHGYDDGTVERGTILEADGKDSLRFVFGKAGIVSVKIKTESGYTLVELQQEDIPADEESKISFHLGCTKGWAFYLANLKSVLEGGVDLRNRNINLKNVISS